MRSARPAKQGLRESAYNRSFRSERAAVCPKDEYASEAKVAIGRQDSCNESTGSSA
jgi:hypothetical protein